MCRLMLSRSVGRVHISSARVGIGFGLGDFNFDEVSSSSLPVFCLCRRRPLQKDMGIRKTIPHFFPFVCANNQIIRLLVGKLSTLVFSRGITIF